MRRSRLIALLALLWVAMSTTVRTHDGEPHCPCTLFAETVPPIADAGADSPVELGVRFIPERDGQVTGIRFYKSAANVGPHVGKLWSAAGVLLGSVTFENETASGWQEALFATPVQVTAGATYVASYRAPTGHYAFANDFFVTEIRNGPLLAPASGAAGNGVYTYGSGMPRETYRAANYWVDVTYSPAVVPFAVTSVLPAQGATNAAPPISATFSRGVDPASISFRLQKPDGAVVPATVSYDPASRVALLTLASPLVGLTTYTATVSARALTGEDLPAPFSWSFTTGAAGFRDTVVMSGLVSPTTVRFAPGGEIFVAEKSGIIKVFRGFNDSTPVVFADLRTQVHNFWDRGLLGLALHPDFPQQPYVYVAYAHDAVIGGTAPLYGTPGATSDPCPSPQGALADGCIISARVSRLRAIGVPDGYQMDGAEQVLVEGWGQQYPSHSIGAIEFGADGALYVTGGEGASYSFVDYGQAGSPPNPLGDTPVAVGELQTPPSAEGGALRSLSLQRAAGGPVLLNGMVLRIDPDTGEGLPDNPLASSADPNARRVIAEGLRNPYRFTIKPGTSEVWSGDVGWNDMEEINRVPSQLTRVLNFGWPCYEGTGRQSAYEAVGLSICQSLYATAGAVEPPAFQYSHYYKLTPGEPCATGTSSISALAFYQSGAYPSQYNGALFFGDYARRCLWAALADSSGSIDFNRIVSIGAAEGPVDLRAGPGGDIYYVDLGGGRIHRLEYIGVPSDASASASFVVTPATGPAPLAVNFDASQSSGSGLTYRWDFGDGSPVVTGGPLASHSYAEGEYVARLTVTDGAGTTSSAVASISATSAPPVPIIDSPTSAVRWAVGDVVSFSGRASDPIDGSLAASQLSWSVVMYHCATEASCHAHTMQEFAGAAAGSVTAPDHEYPSYMTLTLTARNSRGVSASTTVRLDPRAVTLTFATQPAGLSLAVGSSASAAPFSRTVIVGSLISRSAPATQTMNGAEYAFVEWLDGGGQAESVIAPATDTTYTAIYAAGASSETSLFGSLTPAVADAGADSPVELGVKFRSDVDGDVTGVRFFKSGPNTGPHVGSLWTAAGVRLGTVTFADETASGWQVARFAAPIRVTAGALYVVSYHTTVGHYAHTGGFFATQHDAGVLHAPASSASANGVFKYGPAGSFPNLAFNGGNYWVDVLFTATPDTVPPAVTAHAPVSDATDVSFGAQVSATFSEPMASQSITSGNFTLRDEGGAAVAGAVAYDDQSRTATFTPSAPLAAATRYTVQIGGGTSLLPRDLAGNALPAPVTWSFQTASAAACPCSLFPVTATPQIADAGADSPVELGLRFRASTSGSVLGVRFLKSPANTGVHVGSLWSAGGTRLAYVTFSSESASGWQEALFSEPVPISAGATYVVSYHTTVGHFSVSLGFFNTPWDRAPLHAPASSSEANGLYRYGPAGQFPTSSINASNYWVDVVFVPGTDTTPPAVASITPASGATDVARETAVSVAFNEALGASSVTGNAVQLRDPDGLQVPATVSYDAVTKTVRLTPASALQPSETYTIVVADGAAGVRDLAGNPIEAEVTSTFTTIALSADGCPCTLFAPASEPAVVDAGPDSAVELGLRFISDEDGFITGVRFYKSAANGGTHIGSLWSATGGLLARVTFGNETASGWQEALFAAPVAIVAGQEYVISYHVDGGHYSFSPAYFTAPVVNAPLRAATSTAGRGNGVYAYGTSPVFPSASYNSANYWVDAVFRRQ